MKIIAYNKRPAELDNLKKQLAKNGFNVIGAMSSMDQLHQMASEHEGSITLLRPEILGFMSIKEEFENNSYSTIVQHTAQKSSLKLFVDKGQLPLLSAELWRSAVTLANERYEAGLASVHTGIYLQEHCLRLPRGYESLPSVWHITLPGLIKYLLATAWKGKEVTFIEKFEVNDGVLDIGFICENIINDPSINKLRNATRIFLNRHLYPSRWTPLLPQHQVDLHNERMDLREEIERVHGRG